MDAPSFKPAKPAPSQAVVVQKGSMTQNERE